MQASWRSCSAPDRGSSAAERGLRMVRASVSLWELFLGCQSRHGLAARLKQGQSKQQAAGRFN